MNKLILLPLLLAIFYCYIFYTFFIYNCSHEYYNFYIKKTISANHKEIELFKNNVLKTNILYNHNYPGLLLYKGWSHQGSDSVWSNCNESLILFNVDINDIKNVKFIKLSLAPLGEQNIKIYLNSKEIYNNKIKDKRKLILDIKELTLKHTNELKFILKDAHAPSKIDRRLLGIEFYDLLLSYT